MDSVQLPYQPDSLCWFQKIRSLPWPVMLHSADGSGVDIISAMPDTTLSTQGQETRITSAEGTRIASDDPFQLVQQTLESFAPKVIDNDEPSPVFRGGAIGFFGYDLCRRIEKLPVPSTSDISVPDMAVGIYCWSIETNHQQRTTTVRFFSNCSKARRKRIMQCLNQQSAVETAAPDFQLTSHMTSNFTGASYHRAFNRISEYIRTGDCYQVNLAQRFSGTYIGDSWSLYSNLSRQLKAPFSAFMDGGHWSILSLSPERFLSVENGRVRTQPIKGTRPRSEDPQEDRRLAQELVNSDKDRAENLMIVDLLRNDLGRSCTPGSIKVTDLFRLETFRNVHHLVSDITGKLTPSKTTTDLLRGCFPGGSITGAPKIRAMEIIYELEPHRRSVYCGSMGYIGFDGAMDTNIAIRTLVCDKNSVYCWAGGGIIADSDSDLEYDETFHKVDLILRTLNSSLIDT